MWRVTAPDYFDYIIIDISIHTLRVEGDRYFVGALLVLLDISIHTLRVEGDPLSFRSRSTPLLISIHTLRVEGDDIVNRIDNKVNHFNPHPPCGG